MTTLPAHGFCVSGKQDANVNQLTKVKVEANDAEDLPSQKMKYIFTDDKSTYNKFHFRLKQLGPERAEEWEMLKRGDDLAAKKNFAAEVLTSKKGKLPVSFKETKTTATLDTDGTSGSWIPYHQMVAKEGEEMLMEMLRGKTVETRWHKKLPPDSQIPWPKNQELINNIL